MSIKHYSQTGTDIEAVEFDGTTELGNEVIEWTGDVDVRMLTDDIDADNPEGEPLRILFINTPSGTKTAEAGSFIVKMPFGGFDVLEADYFNSNYTEKD